MRGKMRRRVDSGTFLRLLAPLQQSMDLYARPGEKVARRISSHAMVGERGLLPVGLQESVV
jgi:hypothetical protein